MDWQEIVQKLRLVKEDFDRSYKCLNIERNTKEETIVKHLKILFEKFEKIRIIINVNYHRLTLPHKAAADNFFSDIRNRLLTILTKKGLELKLPITPHEEISYNLEKALNETGKGLIRIFRQETDIKPYELQANMTQTVVDFLNTASKLIPEFDGKSENLRSFLDSLSLVDSIKGAHESVATSLIKTKLKGNARNLLNNETTIAEIISRLKTSVKGESVEVITAKIMNIKQGGKTANAYCSEIENLTKSLESAYISDGLSSELADKYSTQTAVKALTKNCTIDKVKLIMEAGQFSNMNEAIGKFINSCTEATGQQNTILYYERKYNRNSYRGQYRGRYNYPRNGNNNSTNIKSQRRPNNNFNNGNQNNTRRNRNYVRATESHANDSENC